MKEKLAVVFIIMAGLFWGVMGIFVRQLGTYGFNSIQIASIRIIGTAIILVFFLLVTDPKKLHIEKKDIGWFLGLGIASMLFFTVCYFKTIQLTSLSVAAILLYTAPIMVMIMSVIFLNEKLTKRKIIALIFAFLGCVLVVGIGGVKHITLVGVLTGLGAGFGYGLYSILGTHVLKKYHPYTVVTFTFVFASFGALIICNISDVYNKIIISVNPFELSVFILITGLITAVIPFMLYTLGLKHVEASKASIMASIEPLVATITGFIVFDEKVTGLSALGILLIIGAIVILNIKQVNQIKIRDNVKELL